MGRSALINDLLFSKIIRDFLKRSTMEECRQRTTPRAFYFTLHCTLLQPAQTCDNHLRHMLGESQNGQ